MQQRWTYRCYPTSAQEQILARTFGCARYVYNWALAARTKAFKDGGRMSYAESSGALTALKRQPETVWLNEVSSVPLQQSLRDLQTAFGNFFAKRSGYPTFKKKGARASARYVKTGFKFSDSRRVEIAKLGVLRIRWDRNLPSDPGTAVRMLEEKAERYGKQVSRVDRWFPSSKMCSACGHVVPALPLSIREWICPECGASHDRDLNAALNILAVGQTVAAHGDGVRATSTPVEGACCL